MILLSRLLFIIKLKPSKLCNKNKAIIVCHELTKLNVSMQLLEPFI